MSMLEKLEKRVGKADSEQQSCGYLTMGRCQKGGPTGKRIDQAGLARHLVRTGDLLIVLNVLYTSLLVRCNYHCASRAVVAVFRPYCTCSNASEVCPDLSPVKLSSVRPRTPRQSRPRLSQVSSTSPPKISSIGFVFIDFHHDHFRLPSQAAVDAVSYLLAHCYDTNDLISMLSTSSRIKASEQMLNPRRH